jgi:hypothetical protein
MNAHKILNKLQKVKRTGEGKWMCQCPAHNDKTASLAISDSCDGRVLINCFAGCDTYSILRSVGLDWQDVMPEKAVSHYEKPVKSVIYAADALRLIRFETQVINLIAIDMKKGRIDSEMNDRLTLAMQRINKAYEGAGLNV